MKTKFKRPLAWLLTLVMLITTLPAVSLTADAVDDDVTNNETTGTVEKTFEILGTLLSDFSYTLDETAGTVTLTKYIGSGTSVVVPGSYTVDGTVYNVVLDSATLFRGNTSITSVLLCEGVGFLNNSMSYLFAECSKLTNIDLSEVDSNDVTDMSYLFFKCSALTSLELSGLETSAVTTMRGMFSYCTLLSDLSGYENWDTGSLEVMYHMFNRVASSGSSGTLETIDLSNWDLDQVTNTGWCFQLCYAKEILLPDNLAVMSAGFLNHAAKVTGTTYTIPAGVKKIGYAHTIYDFATNDFVEFIVAEGNTNYKTIDGILYSMDGTKMLAVPRNKTFTDNTYEIPEGVTFLGELSFSRNYNINKLILPNSYEIEYVPLYDEDYIVYEDTGNLNAGTNLSIAIYCYTGITEYAVKADNPNYTSLDGIIYSKDMTQVVAIPARYAQEMVIPAGVTAWNQEAMWADGSSTVDNLLRNSTGVSIPSSLTSIDANQQAMLNRLNLRVETTANTKDPITTDFVITVDEENPVYCLDANGNLVKHSFDEGVVTDPSCAEGGYTTYTCSICENSYQMDRVTAEGHTPGEAVEENCVESTCTVAGSYETVVYCSVCDTELSRQKKPLELAAHTPGEAVEENRVESTCTVAGSYDSVVYCSVCETYEISREKKTLELAAHTPGEAVEENRVESTCTVAGSYETVVYCSVCETYEISRETIEIPAEGHIYASASDLTCESCGTVQVVRSVPIYRMYNPNSGEHFYTGSEEEREDLVEAGWNYEGVAFNFPKMGEPVYRIYNPITGDHLYTMDVEERDSLLAEGWNYEGVAFNSAPETGAPQYRLWNPNAKVGAWHYTGSEEERDHLISLGWVYQGIGWYSSWK